MTSDFIDSFSLKAPLFFRYSTKGGINPLSATKPLIAQHGSPMLGYHFYSTGIMSILPTGGSSVSALA